MYSYSALVCVVLLCCYIDLNCVAIHGYVGAGWWVVTTILTRSIVWFWYRCKGCGTVANGCGTVAMVVVQLQRLWYSCKGCGTVAVQLHWYDTYYSPVGFGLWWLGMWFPSITDVKLKVEGDRSRTSTSGWPWVKCIYWGPLGFLPETCRLPSVAWVSLMSGQQRPFFINKCVFV